MNRISGIRLRAASAVLAIVVVLVFGIVAVQSAQAQTYKHLYTFEGMFTNGRNPFAGLVVDSAGTLYGTTVNGGAHRTERYLS